MDNSDRWVEKYGESFMDFPLKGLKFKKTAWTKKNNHTHCLFCGDEITNEEYNYHTEKQGYASTTKFWWSCPECFDVFTQKYNLPVVKNTVKDIETALSQFKTVVISLENKQYFIKNTDGKITVEHNGVRKSYDSILSMEREQLFYGKALREIIDDIFVGFVDYNLIFIFKKGTVKKQPLFKLFTFCVYKTDSTKNKKSVLKM